MAHEPTRDALIALGNSTSTNPMGFLEGLSDIHVEWHEQFGRTYGFLLFHFRVVRQFRAIVNPVLANEIDPYTDADFQGMNYGEFGGGTDGVDTLGGLANFSSALENWHNTAHVRIQTATGAPMMDARQNIFYRPFWQLHTYIDDLFQIVLQQYADNTHPGLFLTLPMVAAHIETTHHNQVPGI